MKISWYGQSLFHISSRSKKSQVNITINPFEKDVGLKPPRLKTDILLSSNKSNHNLKVAKGKYFLIDSPGEYAIKGIFIEGIPTFEFKKEKDKLKKRFDGNIIYTIETEHSKICHLGELRQKELKEYQLDQIGIVDVLMIPVGGKNTINAEEAVNIIDQIEPAVIIPMNYSIPKLKIKLDKLNNFLSLTKSEKKKPVEKLSIKGKNIDHENPKTITLLKR